MPNPTSSEGKRFDKYHDPDGITRIPTDEFRTYEAEVEYMRGILRLIAQDTTATQGSREMALDALAFADRL